MVGEKPSHLGAVALRWQSAVMQLPSDSVSAAQIDSLTHIEMVHVVRECSRWPECLRRMNIV